MKKNALYVFLMLPMLWLAGCSDYASEGTVDTRIIREQADIEEITGSVYGLKKGADKAVTALNADIDALRSIDNDVWDAVKAQKPDAELPKLTLTYDGVDGSRVLAAYDAIITEAKAKYEREMAEYNTEIKELDEQLAEYESTLAEMKTSKDKHDAYIADYQKAYDSATAKLEKAKGEYNAIFASAIAEVTAAAEKHGISGRYSDSLIGRYRSIDYSKRNTSPKVCPPQRGYFAVDVRDINKQCAYLSVPRNVQGTPAEEPVKAIMAAKFKQFLKAGETLGKKRSWGSKATGLFADVDAAKEKLQNAKSKADQMHGKERDRNYKMRYATQQMERVKKELERRKTEEYIQDYALSGYFSAPDVFSEASQSYLEAAKNHFSSNHMEKTADINIAEIDGVTVGHFEDVDSGYTHLIAVSDVLASRKGRKEVVRSMDMLATDTPAVADADALSFNITRDNIEPRGRDVSEEKRVEEVIGMLLKTMKG